MHTGRYQHRIGKYHIPFSPLKGQGICDSEGAFRNNITCTLNKFYIIEFVMGAFIDKFFYLKTSSLRRGLKETIQQRESICWTVS